MNNILKIRDLSFKYSNPDSDKTGWVEIFKDINMNIKKGSIIGIAGKSGCGKTTLAKAIVNYFPLSGYPNNRDFICPCSKNYLSYPALYTHIKQKHNGKPPGEVIYPKINKG